MRWINCGKRFPEDWQYVIIRHKPTKTIITEQNVREAQSDWFEMENGVDYEYVDCEWLDESPSSDPAEVLVKAIDTVIHKVADINDSVTNDVCFILTEAREQYEQLKQQ